MIVVVVPAYNEEKNIGRVVRGLFENGYKDVVVVDDGSADKTYGTALEAGAKVLRHAVNRGQGAALQTGNDFAVQKGARIVVHFDADGQFNPADIGDALKLMRENEYDVILGSRFLDNRSKMPWFKKKIILPVARVINHVLTGVKLTDAHNGFRVLSRNALEKIDITQDGMAHNSEIVYKIKKYNLKCIEHPVEVQYFKFGQGVGGGLKTIFNLLFSVFH
ncbi:glycosyltransferase family 2 protein [Patescibacteria group bacterium]|nr:glycosyltransferase family 2 protein [Patescibacteria group bacterium]